jgi:hypothetical protein
MASANPLNPTAQKVLDYWFGPNWETLGPKDLPDRLGVWFGGGPEIDKASLRHPMSTSQLFMHLFFSLSTNAGDN